MDDRSSLRDDARVVVWRFVVGAGAGSIVGLLVGGIGGRLVMLVLRLASNDALHGATTDDGFVVGRVSTSTFFLLMVTGGLGAMTGVVYVAARSALPARGRAALVGIVAGLGSGASSVDPDSFDFSALDPKAFAIASFTLLPGIAAAAIVLVVDRLLELEPWSSRPLAVVLGLAALVLNVVLVVVVAIGGAALALRRTPVLGRRLHALARVVLPVLLVAFAARSGLELWRDANELL
jgi:hypothetical protein